MQWKAVHGKVTLPTGSRKWKVVEECHSNCRTEGSFWQHLFINDSKLYELKGTSALQFCLALISKVIDLERILIAFANVTTQQFPTYYYLFSVADLNSSEPECKEII